MSHPEQNPSGTPDHDGAPQDPAAGQAPGAPQAPQYGAPAPAAPQAPQYGAAGPVAPQGYGAPEQTDPGKTLGIAGLVLSIIGCTSLIGLILSIVALNKSKKAGYKNGIALAGIIVGAILLVASIIGAIVFVSAGADLIDACEGVPSGETIVWQGETVPCP